MAIFHFKSGRTQDQNEEYIENPADPQEDTSNVEPDTVYDNMQNGIGKVTIEIKKQVMVLDISGYTVHKKE
jgi:hypothetical protein